MLAKKVVPIGAVPGTGFVELKFKFKKRKAAKVVQGTTYAILVTRTDPAVLISVLVRQSDPCPGGNRFTFFASNNSFIGETDDLVFEAFVGY